ncbi:MAG TPA: hypothetical protein PLX90_00575, partial [Anaerolineales bacterium]|nr:hypothetical protein [Anaerolineales bacterium]
LISGLLLIPEVLNLIPIDKFENVIKNSLSKLENFTNIPQRFHPRSWKLMYSEENRQKYIEPITAILGFISSTTWIITVVLGLSLPSKFLVLLGLMLPVYISIERIIQSHGFRLSVWRFILLFISSLFATMIIAPPITLFRILLLVLYPFVIAIKKLFLRDNILRSIITILAILLFIASNIFQLLSAY